jgi:hypothetical protein
MDPAEPIDRIEPLEPMDKMDPLEPIDRIEPDVPGDELRAVPTSAVSHRPPATRRGGLVSRPANRGRLRPALLVLR